LLIEQAGQWADRLSINMELPSKASLKRLAPEKNNGSITAAMGQMHERIAEAREEKRHFAPAGQSTQMIVGADDTTDEAVLATTATLYRSYDLRRVYYSAFSPIPEASTLLPAKSPPLQRENRLYQADWLLRFYGFSVEEIAEGGEKGMLALDIDPKLAWALKHRERFPVDVNKAEREILLRVPGLGALAVDKIIAARRHTTLRLSDIGRLTAGLKRLRPFLVTADYRPVRLSDQLDLRGKVAPPRQLSLFA
jgi:predicted DNA-binding helix-hairpin-helix protein